MQLQLGPSVNVQFMNRACNHPTINCKQHITSGSALVPLFRFIKIYQFQTIIAYLKASSWWHLSQLKTCFRRIADVMTFLNHNNLHTISSFLSWSYIDMRLSVFFRASTLSFWKSFLMKLQTSILLKHLNFWTNAIKHILPVKFEFFSNNTAFVFKFH